MRRARCASTTRLRLTPGGHWAATAGRIEGSNKPLLTGLPDGPFVRGRRLQYSEPLRNLASWFFSERRAETESGA